MIPVAKRLALLLLPLFLQLQLQAQEEGEKEYQGLLWAVTGNGIPDSSYLYGTMHTRDARAFRFPDGTMKAFEKADAYAMELNMDSVNQLEVMSQLMMKDSLTLKELLTEEEFADVEAFLKDSLEMNIQRFQRMQPMVTLSTVQMQNFAQDSAQPLDLYFFTKAKKKGKKVIGLERTEEQIDAFHSIPYEKQARELVKLARGKSEASSSEELLEHYVEGDLNEMLEMSASDHSYGDFVEEFLTKRNHRMADRAVGHMKAQSLFIAVGAAHLPGPTGIIELLRKKGFEVVPLAKEE